MLHRVEIQSVETLDIHQIDDPIKYSSTNILKQIKLNMINFV